MTTKFCIESLNLFLQKTKTWATNLSQFSQDSFRVVLGNESADMDSLVCSIFTSYYRSKLHNETTSRFLPVLNLLRKDFSLRSDVVYLFRDVGIQLEHLTFIDEINLSQLFQFNQQKFKLIIVDHNNLAINQKELGPSVEEIIDHHLDEGFYEETTKNRRTIEKVGSCTTLVCDLFFQEIYKDNVPTSDFEMDNSLSRFLLAPILIDTVNFNPQAVRGTPKDLKIVEKLLEFLPSTFRRNEFFETLRQEKITSISSISPHDMLRKDYKEIEMKSWKVGISSISQLVLKYFLNQNGEINEGILHACEKFTKDKNLVILLVMGNILDGESLHRDLIIFSIKSEKEEIFFDDLTKYLEENQELKLKPVEIQEIPQNFLMKGYSQENVAASRKQMIPIVQSFLSKL